MAANLPPAMAAENRVGVFIAQEIKPFMAMVEGLEAHLEVPVSRILLDKKGESYVPRQSHMGPEKFAVLVAVGPGALTYLLSGRFGPPVVYGMVLNPDNLVPEEVPRCGVSLNLSPSQQTSIIGETLPEITRVGVLFDPANNQAWFDSARIVGRAQGIALVPLAVSDRAEIANLFKDGPPDVDAILFIPDRTVISKAIIQFVIKEAILSRTPTIGYNRFFYESGAACSFVIDYRAVGEQVAGQVKAILGGRLCASTGPPFKVLLNTNVVRTLGLRIRTPLPALVEQSP
jgi:putative ABC transport system substrate-binding protein